MGMSIGVGNLDTAAIVDQLMGIEANPQVLLKQKLSKQNSVVTALQGVNARVASLEKAARALSKPDAWTKTTATSSSTSVSVSTSAGSGSGSLTFSVTQVAQKASYTSGVITNLPAGTTKVPQAFSITGADGVKHDLTADGTDAADFAKAINAADAGVVATAVRSAEGQYRLLVTAKETGVGTLTFSGSAPTMNPLSEGQDAKIYVGPAGAGFELTSRSNTFTDLMAGASVTVSKIEAGVTVTAAPNTGAVASQITGVIGSLGVVFSEITSQTSTAKGAVGNLAGSSLLRGLQQQLASAAWAAVPGATLKDVGVELQRDGSVTFDQAAFTAYAAKEPAKAQALITAYSTAVADIAKGASDSSTGSITQAVTIDQSTATDLTNRIADWDDRLAQRRTTLERTYAALQVALDKSSSTSSWLSSALAGLPSYS